MKKQGSDNSGNKKKPASKTNKLEEKKLEKYKKQALNEFDEDDDYSEPEPDDINLDLDDFDDYDDDDDDDY